jgi:hypothetical protein
MEITQKELTQIEDLTRRYATYSRSQAGLSAAWGGLCLVLLSGLVLRNDILLYSHYLGLGGNPGFWRFLWKQPDPGLAQGPFLSSIALALPVLWLLGRAWIQRRVYERHGLVIEAENPLNAGIHLVHLIAESAMAAMLILGVWIDLAFWGFPAARIPGALLSNVVVLMLPLFGRRMVSSPDRNALLMLCLGSALVLAGGHPEILLATMLGYAVSGLALVALGLFTHSQFCKVKRELDDLPVDTSGPPSGAPTAVVERRSFAPRILPRGGADLAVALAIAALQAAWLFILPSLVAGYLTHSSAVGEYTFLGLLVVFLSFSVEKLTIDQDGIRFHRLFGSPKFLAWERIVEVEEAPQSELIIRSWIWPPFPAREMTACLSSIGHYRITWDGGYCYFPPADVPQFEALVAKKVRNTQAALHAPVTPIACSQP